MTARSYLPKSMDVADVQLHVDDGGAAHVDHDPNASGSLLPKFPVIETRLGGFAENLPMYRHRAQTAMRVWVRFAFSDLASAPSELQPAIDEAVAFATRELDRPLWVAEFRLLAEAVRDVMTASAIDTAAKREDKIRQREWLQDYRGGHR